MDRRKALLWLLKLSALTAVQAAAVHSCRRLDVPFSYTAFAAVLMGFVTCRYVRFGLLSTWAAASVLPLSSAARAAVFGETLYPVLLAFKGPRVSLPPVTHCGLGAAWMDLFLWGEMLVLWTVGWTAARLYARFADPKEPPPPAVLG